MARKGSRVFEPVSTPLEDRVLVNYKLVGTPEWFVTQFEPGAVLPEEMIVIRNSDDLLPVKEDLRRKKVLGVDTETTGKIIKGDKGYSMNPVNEGTKLVLLQIGDETMVYLIDPSLAEEFKEFLETSSILKLLQNALYDFKWLLTKVKIHLNRMYDTMLAEQVLTAGTLGVKVGLADICRKYDPFYLISKAVRSKFVELNNGRMSRDMVYYAARDIVLMFPVFRQQIKLLKDKKLEKTAALEFSCIPCTAEMELGGVYLKEDKLRLLIRFWIEKQVEMEQLILNVYNKEIQEKGLGGNFLIPELSEVFDLGSSSQKLEALRMLGFELEDTKRETLMAIDHPIAQLLGEYSNVTKMTSTYGENMLNKINEFTGMWHPRFAQMGLGEVEASSGRDSTVTTATGRYVSDAQQFPRKQERYAPEFDQALIDQVTAHFADEINKATQVKGLAA